MRVRAAVVRVRYTVYKAHKGTNKRMLNKDQRDEQRG